MLIRLQPFSPVKFSWVHGCSAQGIFGLIKAAIMPGKTGASKLKVNARQ